MDRGVSGGEMLTCDDESYAITGCTTLLALGRDVDTTSDEGVQSLVLQSA